MTAHLRVMIVLPEVRNLLLLFCASLEVEVTDDMKFRQPVRAVGSFKGNESQSWSASFHDYIEMVRLQHLCSDHSNFQIIMNHSPSEDWLVISLFCCRQRRYSVTLHSLNMILIYE